MNHNQHKYLLSTTALFLSLANISFADVDNAQMRNLENRVSSLEQRRGSSGVINPSGRPQVKNGANLFITADLLYWQAHEDNIPICIESENTTNLDDASVKGLDWEWNFGCRVGVGYNTDHDGWDLAATWLHFNTDADEKERADEDGALWPSINHPGAASKADVIIGDEFCQKAKAHWAMNLNQIDLDLGREYYVSKWLTLRPHVGLRTAWVHQHINPRFNRFNNTPGIDEEIEISYDFWGIGLQTGINTQWGLGSGWSIYGDAGFALLYGFHDMDREEEVAYDVEFEWGDIDWSYRTTRAVADLALGLRWDSWTNDERVHFRLQAGWEHHAYFGQNQFPRYVNAQGLGLFVANQGDLTLQGWTLSARLDF